MAKGSGSLLQEAVLRSQANARAELLPTDDPQEFRYQHFIIDTTNGNIGGLSATEAAAWSKLLREIVNAVEGRWDTTIWRVCPEVEEIVIFDPPCRGWKGFARFTIGPL